jgi:hypothetical protein
VSKQRPLAWASVCEGHPTGRPRIAGCVVGWAARGSTQESHLTLRWVGTMGRELRGWNGTLRVGADRVVIRRGIRGRLVRKRRDADVEVPFAQVATVRYAPARGVVGYVQIIEDGASNADEYLRTIRDPHTVTFVTRSGRWRKAAQEIAALSGAPLEAKPAAAYWGAVFGSRSSGRRS